MAAERERWQRLLDEQDFETAGKELREATEAGNGDATMMIGLILKAQGLVDPAKEHFKKGAMQGSALAMYHYAHSCLNENEEMDSNLQESERAPAAEAMAWYDMCVMTLQEADDMASDELEVYAAALYYYASLCIDCPDLHDDELLALMEALQKLQLLLSLLEGDKKEVLAASSRYDKLRASAYYRLGCAEAKMRASSNEESDKEERRTNAVKAFRTSASLGHPAASLKLKELGETVTIEEATPQLSEPQLPSDSPSAPQPPAAPTPPEVHSNPPDTPSPPAAPTPSQAHSSPPDAYPPPQPTPPMHHKPAVDPPAPSPPVQQSSVPKSNGVAPPPPNHTSTQPPPSNGHHPDISRLHAEHDLLILVRQQALELAELQKVVSTQAIEISSLQKRVANLEGSPSAALPRSSSAGPETPRSSTSVKDTAPCFDRSFAPLEFLVSGDGGTIVKPKCTSSGCARIDLPLTADCLVQFEFKVEYSGLNPKIEFGVVPPEHPNTTSMGIQYGSWGVDLNKKFLAVSKEMMTTPMSWQCNWLKNGSSVGMLWDGPNRRLSFARSKPREMGSAPEGFSSLPITTGTWYPAVWLESNYSEITITFSVVQRK